MKGGERAVGNGLKTHSNGYDHWKGLDMSRSSVTVEIRSLSTGIG